MINTNKYIKKIQIANICLENNILVAPMAGITDEAFRYITNKYGGPGAQTIEMVSASAVNFDDKKTMNMIKTYEGEKPKIIQIFGADKETIISSAMKLEKHADILDLNIGCPMPKIANHGAGAGMLKDLDKLEDILISLTQAVDIPVTIKTRIGYNQKITIFDVLDIAHRANVAAITIHGRFLEQIYAGDVDMQTIAEVKKRSKIPIIANGGIFTKEDAKIMFEKTNADGIMLARGIIGRPWLAKEILENRDIEITQKDRIEILKEHFNYMIKTKGEERASKEIRKYFCYYTKGFKNSNILRGRIAEIVDSESFFKLLSEIELVN